MRYAKQLIALALMAAIATPMVAIAQEKTIEKKVDINALSKKLDELYRSESSKAVMTMQIVTPNYERTLEMEMTTKGSENTLIRILSPRKEKGISTLKRGNEMWNYLPKVDRTMKVPAAKPTTPQKAVAMTPARMTSSI